MRMIAGPNGSGKSTLFDYLRAQTTFSFGFCLNPDEVERELQEVGRIDFGDWGLRTENDQFQSFVALHPLQSKISGQSSIIRNNILLQENRQIAGYFVAVLCDFLRQSWIASGQSFTTETVMSAPDKLRLLESARNEGFRTYLYFVSTESTRINRERVASRVVKGGHDVPEDKIDSRYERSMRQLRPAIRLSNRAYLFDNSGETHRLIAEYEGNALVQVDRELPQWFATYCGK
jgi:predicted ABC-type ATPase